VAKFVAKFIVLLDACVIFPYSLVDTLLRAAERGLYQVHFSEKILDEALRNRVKRGMTEARAKLFHQKVVEAFPDALVETSPELEALMTNDPKDRHVLAAAVSAKVDFVITSNLKDFPSTSLAPWNITAIPPDTFLEMLCDEFCDEYGDAVMYEIIVEQAASYRKSFDPQQANKIPPVTTLELISVFAKEQPNFADRMRSRLVFS
jgi:predicted nucleic acid-binding protein